MEDNKRIEELEAEIRILKSNGTDVESLRKFVECKNEEISDKNEIIEQQRVIIEEMEKKNSDLLDEGIMSANEGRELRVENGWLKGIIKDLFRDVAIGVVMFVLFCIAIALIN